MSIEISPILRVRAISESTFGTDETGSLGSFTDIPFREGSVTWATDREMLDTMTGKQHIDASDLKIPGWRRGTLSMTHNLAPSGTPAGDGVTATVPGGLGLLLKIGMGVEKIGVGDAVVSSTSSSVFVTAGTGSLGTGGSFMGRARDSDSIIEGRRLESLGSQTAVVLGIALTDTPSAADVIYGGVTYALGRDPAQSAQFVIEGAEADDGWVLAGCQLDSMSMDITPGQIPTITLSWKCATYLRKSEASGTIGDASAATYSDYSPIIAEGDFLVRRDTDGVALPSPSCMASITISFGLSYAEAPCPSGVSGLKRWRRVKAFPAASGSYTIYYEDEQAWADRDAKEPRSLTWQLGEAAGYIVMVEWPYVQITDVQRVDNGGLVSQAISFEAHRDPDSSSNATSDDNTDLAGSPFRLHFA